MTKRIFTVDRAVPVRMLNATIKDTRIHQSVIRCVSQNWSQVGVVELEPGEVFYLVRSKFDAQQFFVMRNRFGFWECSMPDLAEHFAKRVEMYRESLKTRKLQKEVA